MSNLISILNSGESLEKTLVLTNLATKYNPDFYLKYDKITVFYYENLPRQEKNLGVHGTLKGLIENIKEKNILRYKSLDDLWEDRNYILEKIYNKNRISNRVQEKLRFDKKRFDKIIPQVPWSFVLENFKEFLIDRFINYNKNINLEFLDFKIKSEEIIKNIPSSIWYSKIYLLNSDGSIGSKVFWKDKYANSKKNCEVLRGGVVVSPNVHMFLLGIYDIYKKENDNDILIGFRDFSKRRRVSYEQGINLLKKSNWIEEPRNALFNKLLDKIDEDYGNISSEKKTNLAIYGFLNNIL